jgi:hypothetical protein
MEKKERAPNWTDCKRNLGELDRAGLIRLIQDLYTASKGNQSFLHARFSLGTAALKPYKKTISRWVSPNVLTSQYYSVSKAKKAISDYRKAIGDPDGLAELSVFYCEESVTFANTYGVDDEGYAHAIARMFEQALKSIKNIQSKRKQILLVDRLDSLRQDIQFGYGVEESMNELWVEHGLADE